MSTQYSILFKQEHAHDDAIWTAAWGKSEADGSETIVTGSLDDMVKVWKCKSWFTELDCFPSLLNCKQKGQAGTMGAIAPAPGGHPSHWDLGCSETNQIRQTMGPDRIMPIDPSPFSPMDSQLLVCISGSPATLKIYDDGVSMLRVAVLTFSTPPVETPSRDGPAVHPWSHTSVRTTTESASTSIEEEFGEEGDWMEQCK
ncbi:WD repeat-containing protein 61 [Lates japonicus]|uniref:WD repeat-containing protein 61 n=1 Tax=Lates japonicus TaxID=270547 RepID=A0AAD3M3V4_LATJO|nr:WD repeat-containing protein 61 [Lates japonicus]